MTTDHPLEDHTGDALRIFRDCLRPRIEEWVQSASQEHLEALRDRELLQADDLLGVTQFHDPLFLLDLILNSDELNRNLFGRAVGSEQLRQVRRRAIDGRTSPNRPSTASGQTSMALPACSPVPATARRQSGSGR